MDDGRFDSLTRMLASGASRRAVLRSLLGLGGAITFSKHADARSIGTRPTLPPPPPPTTPPPTTTTLAPCPGQEQCPDSTLCCPTGTCARSGNQAICCDGASGHGTFVCGLECCDDGRHCCDGECCTPDSVCLTRLFPESDLIEEEVCCHQSQACDNQCCDGTCFFDPGSEPFLPPPWPWPDASCCPALVGVTYCPGQGEFGSVGACCSGDTPRCCQDASGRPVCVAENQCCTVDDCVEAGFDPDCIACDLTTFTCQPANDGVLCPGTECGVCKAGNCHGEGNQCHNCQTCSPDLTCGGGCPPGQSCIGDACQPNCLALQSICDPFAPTCCQDATTVCSFEANCTTTQGEAHCCRPIGQTCSVRCDCCDNADCVSGICQLDTGQQCLDESECSGTTPECCSGICRDLDNDINNCGGCGIVCQSATNPGEINTCIQGSCGVACDNGYTLCGVFCVLTGSDENHCGSCGNVCPVGQTCCSGSCRDLNTDESSCGECGALCPGTCCNGTCQDLLIDVQNCGACGHNCFIELCGAVVCGVELEDPLPRCCEGNCVDIANDVLNCGACDQDCPLGHECTGAICLTV